MGLRPTAKRIRELMEDRARSRGAARRLYPTKDGKARNAAAKAENARRKKFIKDPSVMAIEPHLARGHVSPLGGVANAKRSK
jgi:hypothetical protein